MSTLDTDVRVNTIAFILAELSHGKQDPEKKLWQTSCEE